MAGLIGLVMVGSTGTFASANASDMPAVPTPAGTDAVLPLLAAIMNENESPYLTRNAEGLKINTSNEAASTPSSTGSRRLLDNAEAAAPPPPSTDTTSGETGASTNVDFYESNLKHGLNGYLYCNMPDIQIAPNTTLRVVVLTMGSEGDLHSIQFAGQILKGSPASSYRAAIEPLMPAVASTVDITHTQPGRWPINCAVHDHLEGGMQATLAVGTKDGVTSAAKAGMRSNGKAGLLIAIVAVVISLLLLC